MKEQELKNAINKINISDEMQDRILAKAQRANYRKEGNYMKSKKSFVLIAVAATLMLGITVFAATYMNWSNGFLSALKISDKQMEELQNSDSSLVTSPQISDTYNGITVSTAQCLYDGNTINLSFYVEGYELDKTVEPELEYLNILIDDKQVSNYEWSFFNGIDWTNPKNPVMADGTPVREDENGAYIPNYRIADGKMEINLSLSAVDDDGKRISDLNNKKITVLMQNFGDTKGKWTLEWNLGELEKGTEIKLNEKLGDTGATITSVVLYPTSSIVYYDFPLTKIQITGIDETSKKPIVSEDFEEPPAMIGVKLKDGTVYTDLFNGGSSGYENGNTTEFVSRMKFSRIIDVDEIESLLFRKEASDNAERKITENDCYVVNIK